MLAKNSFFYLFAHGIPSLLNFSAVVIFTRLMTPEQFGEYALVIAAVSFTNMFLYEWLHLGLLRFLPSATVSKPVFLSTVFTAFLILSLLVLALAVELLLFDFARDQWRLLLLGVLLCWVWGFFHINLQLKTAQILPAEYGRISAGKSIFSLSFGVLLVWYGYAAKGLLAAVTLAMLFSMLLWARREWLQISIKQFNKPLMRKLVCYGFPLAANLAFAEVISNSDRVFLVWIHDKSTTGLYSVGYDLANHILGVLFMIINLSAFPLAIKALESNGKSAAIVQLRKNVILLTAIVLPAATGISILAPGICGLFLGPEFRQAAQQLMPWVAAAALIAGMKSYYFDLAFQLGKYTMGQVKILVLAALVNMLLNLLLIPDFAMMGAIYATIIAYSVGLLLSMLLGRRLLKMPLPVIEFVKILFATTIMAVVCWPFREQLNFWSLGLGIFTGVGVYVLLLLLLNVAGLRQLLWHLMRQTKHA